MNILSARIESLGDHLAMRLTTDTGEALIEYPKPKLLAVAVLLTGRDVRAGKIETSTYLLPPDPRDGRIDSQEIPEATQDPVALELARRWAAGMYDEQGLGEIEVPTFAEADAARWEWNGKDLRKAG